MSFDVSFSEVINMFFQVFDRIGSLWNWYISYGIITVVGWMLAEQKHLMVLEKKIIRILITFGFIFLMCFNYQSLITNYKVLESIRGELQARIELQERAQKSNQTSKKYFETEELVNQIKNRTFNTSFVKTIHLPIDIVIIIIIWLEPILNLGQKSRHKNHQSRRNLST